MLKKALTTFFKRKRGLERKYCPIPRGGISNMAKVKCSDCGEEIEWEQEED